jgi:hypothetical protein
MRKYAAEPNAACIGFEEAELTTRRGFMAGSAAFAALTGANRPGIRFAAKSDIEL